MMDESIEAECDEEIARISSQAAAQNHLTGHQISGRGVNSINHQQNGQVPSEGDSGHGVSGRHDPPRPMSWDGGLSDTENSENDVGVEVEIKEEIEDVEFSSPKPSSAFVISNSNSSHQPTNLTSQSGATASALNACLSSSVAPAPCSSSSSSSIFQSQQSQSHSFYITHSSSQQQRASNSVGVQPPHTNNDPQTAPTDFSVSGSLNSKQQQQQQRSGAGTGNGTAPGNLPLIQLQQLQQLQMQQNAQMCNFPGIQQSGSNNSSSGTASSVTNATNPPQLPSSLPPTSTLNNNIIINNNNSSSNNTAANNTNNANISNGSGGVLNGSGNNNISANNNSSHSAPNVGLSLANSNNSISSTPGGNLLSGNSVINGSSTSGGVISNIVSNSSTNISSGGMLLQQQPPMNLSFPRIPPSPDSALGGWSTPSSNLSRHNSDASQRSFSSSSNNTTPPSPSNSPLLSHNRVVNKCEDYDGDPPEVLGLSSNLTSQGISRQQLINSPCPICGDRISGFHYGIFSCESCKGFFKRTVQNRKNYVCLRGGMCHVAIATRKKCPACRFDKCLRVGMKLEAIREDRTRGGRSTYACSYALPPTSTGTSQSETVQQNQPPTWEIPNLLKEIVECESLWHLSADGDPESDMGKGPSNGTNSNSAEFVAELCAAADRRLYRLVKWCKSLPLFKNIQVDDQTKLLLNSWCELLLFSCCYRSIPMPAGNIRINERLTLKEGDAHGNQCITRMIHFTDNLRRLRLDTVEYAALKVIILMSSEVDELLEGEKVRESQERLLQCLQAYTLARCPESPSKFGELLLKIPELQRICQVGKDMLTAKTEDTAGCNLLFELLRGDH